MTLRHCAGNDNINWMTFDQRQRLRIDMDDAKGVTRFAEYDNFTIGSKTDKYELQSLGDFAGDAGQCNNVVMSILCLEKKSLRYSRHNFIKYWLIFENS